MNKFKLALLLPIVLVFSCNQEEQTECTQEFKASYSAMADHFVSSYRPGASSTEKITLSQSIEEFLAAHKDVECELSGKKVAPTKEAQDFLVKLQSTKVKNLNHEKYLNKVIYGVDNRVDVMESTNESYKVWAKSTLAQIDPAKWDKSLKLNTSTLGDAFGLCKSEPFVDQINPARCSGFLVAPDVVVTAGHCVQTEGDCKNFAWVNDFVKGVTKLSSSQIFRCKEIINRALDNQNGLDYAVIRLDKPITDRRFFSVQTTAKVKTGTSLVVIGHPSGLPTKIADGARVRSNSEEHYFAANLDSYGGNSGSAVINTITGKVEGILVRGETDYVWSDDADGNRCRVSNKCTDDGCRGEDATRLSSVEGIPAIKSKRALREMIFSASSSSLPATSVGWIAEYKSYEYGAGVLAGVKFLDRCGIHVTSSGDREVWKDYFSGKCSQTSEIEETIESFSREIYL